MKMLLLAGVSLNQTPLSYLTTVYHLSAYLTYLAR